MKALLTLSPRRNTVRRFSQGQNKRTLSPLITLALLILTSLACAVTGTPTSADPSLAQTQAALASTQVEMAVQGTVLAQEQTRAASIPPATEVPPPTDIPPTVPPPPTEAPPPTENIPPTATELPTLTPTPEPVSFEDWLPSAQILVYEDWTGIAGTSWQYDALPYVKETLERLGLRGTHVGDAVGDFDSMLSRPWDLVISAKEVRTSVSGDIYTSIYQQLQNGASVIIEEWDLDHIASGKVAPILRECGVRYSKNFLFNPKVDRDIQQIMETRAWSSPFLHDPNEIGNLSDPTSLWIDTDMGDLLMMEPGSTASELYGPFSGYVTAVACLDGRLVLQTFGTHSYSANTMTALWENYIVNALRARYTLVAGNAE